MPAEGASCDVAAEVAPVGRREIDRMIAESLEPSGAPRPIPGRRPLPHGNHILEQYVALCREGECKQAEPSAEVVLPAAPAPSRQAPAAGNPLSALLRRALARVKG
jgi:hypothetical protein